MNFNELTNGKVEGFFLIKSVDKKVSSKGDTYLDITLGDKTGEINAKLWAYNPDMHGEYKANDIVKVRGTLQKFAGSDQLRVEQIRTAFDGDNVKSEDLVRSAEYSSEDMYNELVRLAGSFTNEELKKLVLSIYEDKKDKLLIWPAAYKLHHAIRGGLLLHTLSIVKLAEGVIKIYPFVNRDFLLAGAMLHDIAKIDEYNVGNELGIAENYSVKGNLLGHIPMGAETVKEYADKLSISEETKTLIMHMILSHHGKHEFGAAVLPMTLEAEVLSELDLMDARLYEIKDALSNTDENGFTGSVRCLDGRKFYKPSDFDIEKETKLI